MNQHGPSTLRDYLVLLAALILTAAAGSFIPSLHIDNSVDIFMPKGHEVVRMNEENEKIFGSQDVIMVGISSRYGSVLSADNLRIIRKITEEVESLDHVDDVTSLANADYIINSGWGMEVVDLYPGDMPDDQALPELEKRLADWKDVYSKTLISDDRRMTSIIVKTESYDDDRDWSGTVYKGIQSITDRYRDSDLDFSFAGEPVLMQEMTNSVVHDLTLLIPLSAFIICLIMYMTFRRMEGVVFPMISLSAAAVLTMGVMGMAGITFTMASMLIPILLLVVGSAYCIHIMAHFYDVAADESGFINPDKVQRILASVIAEIRISVLMAGFTTVAGFLSLTSSPLGPFRSFALLTAIGVSFALLSAFTLLPALIRIRYRNGVSAGQLRYRGKTGDQRGADGDGSRVFEAMSRLVRKGGTPVLLLTGAFLLITFTRIPYIETGSNFINFFPVSSPVRQDLDRYNERMSGTGRITVRFDAPEKGGILDPLFLKQVENFSDYMKSVHGNITAVSSLTPQVRRMNRIMNYDSIPYAVAEPVEDDFDSFFDDDQAGESEKTDASSADPFAEIFGPQAPAELEPDTSDRVAQAASGDEYAGESAKEGVSPAPEPVLTYDQLAGHLESALLKSGMEPDPERVIRNFLAGLNYRGAAFDEIPTDPAKYGLTSRQELRNLLAQYMVLYSGSLDYIINDGIEPDSMLMTIILNDESPQIVGKVLDDTRAYWDRDIPENWKYHIAGSTTLLYKVSSLITRSQIVSILIALVIIYIFLVLIYRSFAAGLVGLIPVLAGLAGIFFTMSLAGFNLDFITALLGSLAIGIGVDYAIHFLSAYKRSAQRGEEEHLGYLYRTTGRAIFFNAVSVGAGFLALVLSSFIPIRQLGLMFALAMIFSAGASLVLVPIVLRSFDFRFLSRENGEEQGSISFKKTFPGGE